MIHGRDLASVSGMVQVMPTIFGRRVGLSVADKHGRVALVDPVQHVTFAKNPCGVRRR